MADVYFCYGTFFSVFSEFKKEGRINNWQLHNRLMNVEYVPFDDMKNAFPVTLKSFEKIQEERNNANLSSSSNPYERINDFANCKTTKALPIQRAGQKGEQRFLTCFFDEEQNIRILNYIKTQVILFLPKEKHKDIVKSVIELLSLSSLPDGAIFFIDSNVSIKTTKDEIVKIRTRFNISSFIAGMLFYIVENCEDNTLGKKTIEEWKKTSVPNGASIDREIEIADTDDFDSLQDKDETKSKNTVINYGHIESQKIVNIETVNGDINI